MPSFLGRTFGVPFRTELLIMNIFGLVNSTLDWSPLKWTSKLEKIWNLSIPQKSLIVDTIGEDTIKTVLSWIVITRIVIAHVYTFTYLSNIYPVITWSRPNFLLPWLILSFFKNVVLEVVVIVIGLLLWYGNPFSLVVFLEFVFVKLVPLVLASYNWYSNSCLFLQLRKIEKMRRLTRSMSSDSNLLTNQLYVKIDDPKYRTGSLTTLFSFDSYETYDSRLTPGQNAKKLLGITEQHVKDARIRIKEREAHERLTELDDDHDFGTGGRKPSAPYFFGSNIFVDDLYFSTTTLRDLKSEENTGSITDANTSENLENENVKADGNPEEKPEENEAGGNSEQKSPETDETLPNKEDKVTHKNPGEMTVESPGELKNMERVTTAKVLTRKPAEMADTRKTNQKRTCSPCEIKDTEATATQKEATEVSPTRRLSKNTEKSLSPVKLQALFNCNCSLDDTVFKGSHANCCKATNMRTSTPRSDPDDDNEGKDAKANSEKSVDQSYTYAYNVTNIKTDFAMNSGFPLMENLLKNDFEILKSVKMEGEEGQKGLVEDLSALELGQIKTSVEMEKEWNFFAGQTNLETLLRAAFPREDHEISGSSPNTRIVHPFVDDSLKLEKILDTSGSSFPWSDNKEDNSSPKTQDHSRLGAPLRMENVRKPVAVRATRSVHTQTEETTFSRGSSRSLTDPRPRRKPFFRRKPSKDQNGSVSSASSSRQHSARRNYRPLYFRNKSNAPVLPESPSSDSKKLNLSKSSSNKSVCECKTQKLEAKYCPSTDSSLNRREVSRRRPIKPKIESLATLPLAQVARQPEANPAASKKKPPVYPKSSKKETESVVASETLRKPIVGRKIEVESKQSNKQSVNINPKAAKPRSRGKMATEEQAARELRALRAYNEITLLKDKQEMEVKKRTPRREPPSRMEDLRSSYKRSNPRNDLGKENLSADAATETVLLVSSSSRSNRSTTNAANRLISGSSEKSSYSKPPKASQIKDRENFDRLYESRTIRDNARERVAADFYSRKEYTNYSLSQIRQMEDVTGSPSSSMKLEGAQKGRDLERTEAREDVRGRPSADVDAAVEVRSEEQGNVTVMDIYRDHWSVDTGRAEIGDKEVLTLARKLVEDVSSIWSSGSIDRGGVGVAESSYADSQAEDLPKVEEGAEMSEDSKSVSTRFSTAERLTESVKGETAQQKAGALRDHRKPGRPDLDFTRNIEVINQGNGVILTNPNAAQSRNGGIPTQWDIVDSKTARRLNNALSYKSMDSLLDVPGEIRTVEEILNDSRTASANNELADLFNDQLPAVSRQASRFDGILATIREATGTDQPLGPLDLCIITVDRTDLADNAEIEGVEANQQSVLSEAQLDDVLRSIAEVLRSLNVGELDLESLSRSRLEILGDMIHGTEGEIVDLRREATDDEETDEQRLKKVEEIPRFIKEDIFTDIKFPIVINRSEMDPGSRIFCDPLLSLHSNQLGLNFCGFTGMTNDDEEEDEQVAGSSRKDSRKKVGFSRDTETLRYFDTQDQSFDGNEALSDDEFNAEEYQSAVDETFDGPLDPELDSMLESSEFSEPALRRLMADNLNVTYDVIGMESANEDEADETDVGGIDESEREEKVGTCRARRLHEIAEVNSLEAEEVGECSEIGDKNATGNAELENVSCEGIEDIDEEAGSGKLESIEVGGMVERIEERGRSEEIEIEGNVEREADGIELNETCIEETAGNSKIMPEIETTELEGIIFSSATGETGLEEIETACQEVEVEETAKSTDGNAEERKFEDTVESKESQSLDKHEKEEDMRTVNSGESDKRESENKINTESVRFITNVDDIEGKEESLQVLDSCWIKPDIIIDYCEETDEDAYEEIEPFTGETREVPVSDADQEGNVTELKEETSFKIIVMFWLLVIFFYIRHFYRKMFSLTQVSRATSTLKPYDVHAASTSTSTLLEKTSLLNKLRDGTRSEDDEELFESSVDYESMNISRAIEERLKAVLDLTAERSVSRNSEFDTEEMAEELKRETEELGLNASGRVAEETPLFNKINEESSEKRDLSVSELEEKINLQAAEEVRSFRFEELGRPGSSRSLLRDEASSEIITVHEATVETGNSAEGIQERIVKKELSLVIEEGEARKSSKKGGTNEEVVEEKTMENEEAEGSVGKPEDSPPVQFQTAFDALDSFDSLYTRPSVTSHAVSFSKLDVDDMEEFSAASSTSGEAT